MKPCRHDRRGFFYVHWFNMTDDLLPHLRCPIDPKRVSPLVRDNLHLVCNCGVRFPTKQGIPILIAAEAELPEGCRSLETVACKRLAHS